MDQIKSNESKIKLEICYSGSYNYVLKKKSDSSKNWMISSVKMESDRFKISAPISHLLPSYQWQFLSLNTCEKINDIFQNTQTFKCPMDEIKEMKISIEISTLYCDSKHEKSVRTSYLPIFLKMINFEAGKTYCIEIIHSKYGLQGILEKATSSHNQEININDMTPSQLTELLDDLKKEQLKIISEYGSFLKIDKAYNFEVQLKTLHEKKCELSKKITEIEHLLKNKQNPCCIF